MKHKYVAADKAYAGQKRLQFVVDQGWIPVVAVPKPRKDKEGRPTCLGGNPMEYATTDPEQGIYSVALVTVAT